MAVWFKSKGHGYYGGACINLDDNPAPTVPATMGGAAYSDYYIEDDGNMPKVKPKSGRKPPYRVPSMAEIAAIPWNGLTVASTFSGCGGSCLGYRMAGFRVGWANEFVPAAQDSYRANAAPGSFLDDRDIKLVEPKDVMTRLRIGPGELDLFDGSPPCQAFSTAGKRHKGWGQVKRYEGGHEQLNETLFGQWLRLLRGLLPKTFVAENVSGLVKGTAKGTFLEILSDMKAAGYRVRAKVLDAQWLGVPQQRQRVIFVGVREDLGVEPPHPAPLPWRYSVLDAIPWVLGTVSGDSGFGGKMRDESSPPLPASDARGGRLMQRDARLDEPSPTITVASPGNDTLLVVDQGERIDLQGCLREAWDATAQGKSSDKYFNLVRQSPKKPCTTVTGIGGQGGGRATAAVCHPTERRKFTIAELRRICAFPDDFVLTGTYAQQWERLGNSVPPVMMFWIARAIRDGVLRAGEPWRDDPPCLIAGTRR